VRCLSTQELATLWKFIDVPLVRRAAPVMNYCIKAICKLQAVTVANFFLLTKDVSCMY